MRHERRLADFAVAAEQFFLELQAVARRSRTPLAKLRQSVDSLTTTNCSWLLYDVREIIDTAIRNVEIERMLPTPNEEAPCKSR